MGNWTPNEIRLLRENYSHESINKVKSLLKDRSWKAIKEKARRLGLRRSTHEQYYRFEREPLSDYARGALETALDGEGGISFGKHKDLRFYKRGYSWRPEVYFVNTSKAFVEKIRLLCRGGRSITEHKGARRGWKKYYRWCMASEQIKAILPQLKLVVKGRQAQLLLEALSYLEKHTGYHTPNDVRLEEIYREMRKLNRKGSEVDPRN